MPTPTASERKILKAFAELRAGDHIAASRKVGISSDYADQLCRYLSRWGYLEKRGHRYRLTQAGEQAALKEMERERKPGEEEAGKGMVWDRWVGGFKIRDSGVSALPVEALTWETFRGFAGGGGMAKQRELPELQWEEEHTCAFCDGEGYSPPGCKCPVCKSSGKVTFFEPPVVKCGYCKGKGRKERKVDITCIVCRGKGWAPIKEPIEFCPGCQGKGYSTEDRLPCTNCKGKGVVTRKEMVMT